MQVAPRLYVKNDAAELTAYQADGQSKPQPWSPDVTIIPRADCAFRRLRLAEASAQGYAALRLQALNEARSGHDSVYIQPGQTGRWANIWTFTAPTPLRGKAVPETELQATAPDGIRLATTLFGVEGQFWHDNDLLASRWWPQSPKPHQWASFLQSLDQGPLGIDASALDASIPALTAPPLTRHIAIVTAESFKTGALSPQSLLKPSRLAMAVASLSILASVYLGAQFIKANMGLSKTQTQLEALSERTGAIMQDRQIALANLAAIREFDVLGSRTALLEAWDELAVALEGEPVIFQSFNYLNDEIEIKINGVFVQSAADIVTKVESLPSFEDVTYTLDRGEQSTLKAKLVSQLNQNKVSGS